MSGKVYIRNDAATKDGAMIELQFELDSGDKVGTVLPPGSDISLGIPDGHAITVSLWEQPAAIEGEASVVVEPKVAAAVEPTKTK